MPNEKDRNIEQPTDVFERSIGSFGRWQMFVFSLILLMKFGVGWHQLNIIIIGPPAKVKCETNSNITDGCSPDCEKRFIDPEPFDRTIISQWELVCDDRFLATLVQMLTMLGILIGNALWGFWADRQGRAWPLAFALMIQAISGSAAGFVPWYWAFLVLRFISAVATGGSMCTSFVLLMEITGKKWRVVISSLYQVPTWLGHLSLAGIGYFIRDWRYSQLFISVPSFIFICYFWILPESPRFLVQANKTERAIATLERAAKMNRLPIQKIAADINVYAAERADHAVVKGKFTDLFSTGVMAGRTMILSIAWITCGLCFYGVAQYVGSLAGNIFINITISAVVELPASCFTILFLSFMGRKWTQIVSCLFGGIPMCLIPILSTGIFPTVMAAISLFGLTILFTNVYLYTGELYPTTIRSQGVGMTSMMARIGSIVAPYVSSLVQYEFGWWLTPAIFGIMPLITAALTLFLPETKYSKLPDTLEEAKAIGKKNRPQ